MKTEESIAAYKKDYYQENKESIAVYRKDYRQENKESIAAYQKDYQQENVKNLTEVYVGKIIKQKFNIVDIPEEIIELKRAVLVAKRDLRKRKKSSHDDKNI